MDKINEFNDMILTTAYAGDKLIQFIKRKRKQLAKRKAMKKVKKENESLELYLGYLQEAGFEHKPKGWTDQSVKQAGKTLAHTVGKKSPTSTDFFDRCVKRMKGKVRSPEGYCAALKDEAHGSTYWRGKGKTPKEVKSDIKQHQNV